MDAMLRERWCLVLCYPTPSRECCVQRLTEMRMLGVSHLIEGGGAEVWGVRVLGKGVSSVVVKGATFNGGIVALKVRRLDSRRESLLREAAALREANRVGVGPKLYAYSRNMLVREYIAGVPLGHFASKGDPASLRKVLLKLARQLAALDSIGLAHNELARFEDHVLVVEERLLPVIIDFESATFNARRSNVTQFFSFLLRRGPSNGLRRSLEIGLPEESLRALLRSYKASRDIEAFILELGLED